jgi:ABC-type nitrate/sulfonate/bicarbonate transport system substrate-binding protein
MKRWGNGGRLAVGITLVIFCHLCAAQQTGAAAAPNVRIVYNALGGSMAPLWVAQEMALFAKHGVQYDLNYLAATTAVQALAAGSEDIGLVGNQCIDVALEGADTVYVASTVPRFIFHLYGDPVIKSVGDLKGKVVAATQPSASTDYATRMVLRRFGLTPDKDVKILYAGSMPALVSMLKSKNAVAGLISAPTTLQAEELGFRHILNVTELQIPFVFVGLCTKRRVIQQNPEAVTRVLRAYTESIAIIRRDKETAIKAMGKFLKTDNRAALENIYDEYAAAFPRVPLMTKEEVKAVLEVAKNSRAQQANPEDFFDNSFIHKLDDAGFIQSLYTR